jgi:Protein of unknown function (DUF2695)
MATEIMTPEHHRWHEFTERLGGPEACDFRDDDTWTCHHDYRFCREILRSMLGIDVEGSITSFEENGGHCDCTVLLNIDREVHH